MDGHGYAYALEFTILPLCAPTHTRFFDTDRPRLTRLPSRAHIQVGKKTEGDILDASFTGQWLLGPEPILSYDEDALTIDFIDGAEVTVRPLMMGYYDIIVDDTSLYHCYYTAEAKGILINVIADDEGVGIAPSPASTCLSKGAKKSPRPALPTHERLMEDKDWVLL